MNIKSLSKKLLWLLGMILIGALGSGLWEGFLKQSLMWVGTFILDIATLGLNSLRDGMYLDAAKGTYERTAISF
jgi:4-hydroxybenzoate polyprenyltransferase